MSIDCDDSIWALAASLLPSNEQEQEQQVILSESATQCHQHQPSLEDGEYVCIHCGSVLDGYIDDSAEWRNFEGFKDMTRCGMPSDQLLPNLNNGSMIAQGGSGTTVIRKYHSWSAATYRERCLLHVFQQLSLRAANSGIAACIVQDAKSLYKRMCDMQLSRGEKRSAMIAAAVYMACKQHAVPRSLKEVAAMFDLQPAAMTRGCKKYEQALRLGSHAATACDMVQRFCSNMGLDKEYWGLCRDMVQDVQRLGIASSSTLPTVAAATILFCMTECGLKLDRKHLATACGVSDVTILKCLKRLQTFRDAIRACKAVSGNAATV